MPVPEALRERAGRCVLVCTHRPGGERSRLFQRLVDTLQEELPGGVPVLLVTLVQGCAAVPGSLADLAATRRHLRFVATPDLLPASRARNVALGLADVAACDIVLFPDDDCWYPEGVLAHIHDTMHARQADLLFVWYGEPPDPPGEAPVTYAPPTPVEVMRRTGMITMALAGDVVRRIGGLDERIGLGTDLSGGEDTDYAWRAYMVARRALMTRQALIGHRALADDWATRVAVMPRYWPGLMFQTLKHLRPSLLPLAAYRLGVGVVLVGLRRLPLADFMRPIRRWGLGRGRDA
jgi:hypothetical protein